MAELVQVGSEVQQYNTESRESFSLNHVEPDGHGSLLHWDVLWQGVGYNLEHKT